MYFVCYRFRGVYMGAVHSHGMVTGDSGMMEEFKAMIGVQIASVVAFLVVGGGIAVGSHQFILGVLPSSEWSAIIGWVIAGVVGYVVGGLVVSVIVLGLFMWVMSD
jgi:hypothetical protein